MNTHNISRSNVTPLLPAIIAIIIAAAMIVPTTSHAANWKNNENDHGGNGHGYGYGHLLAFDFFNHWEGNDENDTQYSWLPPGINMLLSRWSDGAWPGYHNGDDNNGDHEDDGHENDHDNKSLPVLNSQTVVTATSTATATVETEDDAKATIYYATDSGFNTSDDGVTELTSDELKTEHELNITGLTPDTTYYYRIELENADGKTSLSDEMSFTTDIVDTVDDTAPAISDLNIDATDTSATVTWNTDENANSAVYLSTTTPVDMEASSTISVESADLVAAHELTADELSASTTYYVVVRSTDEAGNETVSSETSFTTQAAPDTTAPVISNVSGSASSTTIIGNWDTNEPTTATVYTSTDAGFALDADGVIVTTDDTLGTTHTVTISGLTPGTTYYHRIVVEDEAGNTTTSPEYTLGTFSE